MGAEGELVGLVPAAGKGLRLGLPYPKELYPIIRDNRYKPVAQHVLENLVASGVRHVVVVVNETKHQLVGYFGSGRRFGCAISYVYQEGAEGDEAPSAGAGHGSGGLAHALDAGWHLTRGRTVAFGMADTIMQPVDVFRALLASEHGDAQVVLGLFRVAEPAKFGMVALAPDGAVLRIDDKPARTDLELAWGCIVWRPRFTELLHARVSEGQGDFAAILNEAVASGLGVRGVEVSGGSYADFGTYEEIRRLERETHG